MIKLKHHKFSDLYAMSSGISSKPEQAGHGAPFLSFQTVFHNHFIPKELNDLMSSTEKEQETHSICKGDIFLTRTSEVIDELGMSCVALEDYPKATFSGFLKRFRPIKDNIAYEKYMGFYLRSQLFRKSMTNNATMTLRASLNKEIVSYLDLYLPEYATQKTIGDFLFLLNSKIECNNRINTELEAMAKTLYNYWFLQFDFPNENGMPYKSSGGKMVYNSTLEKEIPQEWEFSTLSSLAETNPQEKLPNGCFAPHVEMRAIPEIGSCIGYITPKTVSSGTKFRNNDVLLARITPCLENGKTALVQCLKDNLVGHGSTEFIVLRSKHLGAEGLIYLIARNKDFRNYCICSMTGTSGRQRISSTQVAAYPMAVPPAKIIQRFAKHTSIIFKKIGLLHAECQQLSQLRDWLLPMLMNGQVTVQ